MARIIRLNKPFKVLSQFTDKDGRATLMQYLPEHSGFYPAGRLDYDSEGLLLLTDCGALQHQISHPSRKLEKTYWVQVEGIPSEEALQTIRQGVLLNDGPCRPARVRTIAEPAIWERTPPIRERINIPTSWLEITLSEGRNRQVRRMTAAVGYPTLRLVRMRIGDWNLDDLGPGEWKMDEVHMPTPENRRRKHRSRRQ